jgi:hypothetical protein
MTFHSASITLPEGWWSVSICLVCGSGGRKIVEVLYSYVRKSESVRWKWNVGVREDRFGVGGSSHFEEWMRRLLPFGRVCRVMDVKIDLQLQLIEGHPGAKPTF